MEELPLTAVLYYTCNYSVKNGIYNHAHVIDTDVTTIITIGPSRLAHFCKGNIGEDMVKRENLPELLKR